jgi:ribosomal protein L3 glutamine methyltransferase
VPTALEAIDNAHEQMRYSQVCCGHGYETLEHEAAVLVGFALGVEPQRIDQALNQVLSPEQLVVYQAALDARCRQRLPLAYITGDIWFYGQRFLADQRALVPRSLIAALLPHAIAPWLESSDSVQQILDLCTGSASLAIIAAQAFPNAKVTASDISGAALALADENRQLHNLTKERLSLVQSDLFTAPYFQSTPKPTFDLILCNPPYVNSTSVAAFPAEFLAEPTIALGSGTDGMDLVRAILDEVAEYLRPNGLLVLEIGHEIEHFMAAFARLEFVSLPVEAGDDMVLLIEHNALRKTLAAQTKV